MEIKQDNSRELVVKAKLKYTGGVGYGNIYACDITDVPAGKIAGGKIDLVVMAGDTEKKIENMQGRVFLMRFAKHEEHVPHHLMPITGFVDENMTSWKLLSLEEAKN